MYDNYYVRKSGDPLAAPIANRSPAALQKLLVGDRDAAEQQLRLLTRSELLAAASAAEEFAQMARTLVVETWPNVR